MKQWAVAVFVGQSFRLSRRNAVCFDGSGLVVMSWWDWDVHIGDTVDLFFLFAETAIISIPEMSPWFEISNRKQEAIKTTFFFEFVFKCYQDAEFLAVNPYHVFISFLTVKKTLIKCHQLKKKVFWTESSIIFPLWLFQGRRLSLLSRCCCSSCIWSCLPAMLLR